MESVRLEEVFKISGVPDVTFVPPSGFEALKVALRTAGRGVVVEGPSGIGKSTAVARALEELDEGDKITKLSARVPSDVEYISLLPELDDFGVVVVDDFHRLDEPLRMALADLLKVLADTEEEGSKLVLVGINRARESLINHAPDLTNRIETIRFESEPPDQVERLISLGEVALNVELPSKGSVVEASHGSFYIAQLLCFELCLKGGLSERAEVHRKINPSFSTVRRSVLERQEGRFGAPLRAFGRGPKFRPSGRGPYLHILQWLREAATWSISLKDEIARHPQQRASVSQVVDKGILASFLQSDGRADLFHLDSGTNVLSIEDPHLAFYIQNLDWPKFVADVGFTNFAVDAEYDIALSFAGEDRVFAEALYDALCDEDVAVFYDKAEQHRILAKNVETYLAPIYESGARYVVAVLGEKYGEKRWTIFESDHFKPRLEKGEVVPIWSTKLPSSAFDAAREVGYLTFDPDGDPVEQARRCASSVTRMLGEASPAG